MLSAITNQGGYKSIYKKQALNDEKTTTNCSNIIKLYFHNGDSLKKAQVNNTESKKINPSLYSLGVGSNATAERTSEIVAANIKSFLQNNPEVEKVNIKFYTFDSNSDARIEEIKKIITQQFPNIQLNAVKKSIDYLSLKDSRFRNKLVYYMNKLNKNGNFKYENEFLVLLDSVVKLACSTKKYI